MVLQLTRSTIWAEMGNGTGVSFINFQPANSALVGDNGKVNSTSRCAKPAEFCGWSAPSLAISSGFIKWQGLSEVKKRLSGVSGLRIPNFILTISFAKDGIPAHKLFWWIVARLASRALR